VTVPRIRPRSGTVTDHGRQRRSTRLGGELTRQGVRRPGRVRRSSTGSLFISTAGCHTDTAGTTVTLGARAVERIGRVLAARLPFDRGLLIESPDAQVGFGPGDYLAITDRGDGYVEIELPPALLAELTTVLRPVAGTYHLPSAPGVTITVVTQIRDQSGTVIAEVG
jgi:suppressor of fused-like protein